MTSKFSPTVLHADISKFIPFKHNKRIWGKKHEENPQLTELIRRSGHIEPLIVCKLGSKLEIISGNSRYCSAVSLNSDPSLKGKFSTLPYSLFEAESEHEKLIEVIIRNIGHACHPIKLVRAIVQFLLLTDPTRKAGKEKEDAVADEADLPIESTESVLARTTEIVNRLEFQLEHREKWIKELTRLYQRATGNRNANRVLDNASKAAEKGLEGLAASNDKAEEQAGIIKKPQEEQSAHVSADTAYISSVGDSNPGRSVDDATSALAPKWALDEIESLKKKVIQEKAYGDSQGESLNKIESELLVLCEKAHIEARRQGKDVVPVVGSFKLELLMQSLGLKFYIHPEQAHPEEASQDYAETLSTASSDLFENEF